MIMIMHDDDDDDDDDNDDDDDEDDDDDDDAGEGGGALHGRAEAAGGPQQGPYQRRHRVREGRLPQRDPLAAAAGRQTRQHSKASFLPS